MFTSDKKPTKSPAQPGGDHDGAGGKPASRSNPLWQSLALKPETESPISNPAGSQPLPLDQAVRQPLEQFFQQPLDQVRVHADSESRAEADSRGAVAMTIGQNIHLGSQAAGLPEIDRRALLAHETVHTLQQGNAGSSSQLSSLPADPAGSPYEQDADALSAAFTAHQAGYSPALAIRDRVGVRPLSAGRLQLSRVRTHYGEFEDFKFNDLIHRTSGDKVGVQMYLKFHPGNNVEASKIGLTQAAEGKASGAQVTEGIYGRRQATSGPGAGYFIDRVAGRPSPMYGTVGTATTGKDATKFEAYNAPGINPLSDTRKATLAYTGADYGGGSIFGYRYLDGTTRKGPVPAEMHDMAAMPVSNSSEQMFETAALAFEGSMAGTYLGSVEWGWRRDNKGVFTSYPISRKSMGTPSANFLTAATVWNTSKENYGLLANGDPTNILKQNGKNDFTVAKGTPLTKTAQGTMGTQTFYAVNIADNSGRSGFVLSTDTVMGDFGRATVKLPVPEIYTVNVVGGTVLDGETKCSPSDPILPYGTRVRITGPFSPRVPGVVRVEVVDGSLTGTRGVIRQDKLTRETLGTH